MQIAFRNFLLSLTGNITQLERTKRVGVSSAVLFRKAETSTALLMKQILYCNVYQMYRYIARR